MLQSYVSVVSWFHSDSCVCAKSDQTCGAALPSPSSFSFSASSSLHCDTGTPQRVLRPRNHSADIPCYAIGSVGAVSRDPLGSIPSWHTSLFISLADVVYALFAALFRLTAFGCSNKNKSSCMYWIFVGVERGGVAGLPDTLLHEWNKNSSALSTFMLKYWDFRLGFLLIFWTKCWPKHISSVLYLKFVFHMN